MKMVREIGGCFGDAGPDDEFQPHLIEGSEIAWQRAFLRPQRSPSPRPRAVASLELPDNRHDGVGFGLVALEAPDFEREPGAVDE